MEDVKKLIEDILLDNINNIAQCDLEEFVDELYAVVKESYEEGYDDGKIDNVIKSNTINMRG